MISNPISVSTRAVTPQISLITVVWNDEHHIAATIESGLAQTGVELEYIVVDGASSDGTLERLQGFSNRIRLLSEPDQGIYDAMNKGVEMARGEWVMFLNSGDILHRQDALSEALRLAGNTTDIDVIYGDSIEISAVQKKHIKAHRSPTIMDSYPAYRHGSSLTRRSVQASYRFDLSQRPRLGYALDWELIHRLYKDGKQFKYVEVVLQEYLQEGISNRPLQNLWYSYLITSQGRFAPAKFARFCKDSAIHIFRSSSLYKWLHAFAVEWMVNSVLPHLPFWWIRKHYLQLIRAQIGKGSFIMKTNYLHVPNRLRIGQHSHINRGCTLDARAGITIGNSVSISHGVSIFTGSHDAQSPHFLGVFKPVVICDYAWVGANATLLQGITIGKGAVVCAGAVVTKDVAPFDIVAGIPAKIIGQRNRQLEYQCKWETPLC